MYWCIKTINYLEASTLNEQLIKEGLETLRSCPLRNFWRETALLIDVTNIRPRCWGKNSSCITRSWACSVHTTAKATCRKHWRKRNSLIVNKFHDIFKFYIKKKYFYTFTVSCPICESHLHISFNPVVLKNLSITNNKVLKYAPKNSLHAHFKIRVYMSK